MQISRVATMARVIEPIGLLSRRMLLHPSSTFTTNTYALSNGPSLRRLFNVPSSSSRFNYLKPCHLYSDFIVRHYSDVDLAALEKPKKFKKQKKPVSPETAKKAQVVKQLYKINKEMFGELLETRQEKTKRIKKETKKVKKLSTAVPIRDDDYYLNPNIDTLEEHEPESFLTVSPETITSFQSPRSLPNSEKVWHKTPSLLSPEKAKDVYNKEAEINWTLNATRKMTKVFKGNFNKPSSNSSISTSPKISLTSSSTTDTEKKGNLVQVNSSHEYNNDSQDPEQELKSRGAGACPQAGQSSGVAAAVTGQLIEAHKQFINLDSQHLRNAQIPEENEMVRHNPSDSLANHAIKSKNPTTREFRQPVKFYTILNKKNFTDKDEEIDGSCTAEEKSFSQESGNYHNIKANPKIETEPNSKEYKADNKGANVCNQESPSIIITVPYFNPERLHAASQGDPNLDQTSTNSHPYTESYNLGNNSGGTDQIISIPFARSFSKPSTSFGGDEDSQNRTKQYLPSVSKILSATMPIEQAKALERWQAKMIFEMGEEGFRVYKENMLNNGKMLHSNIEMYLRGTPLNEISVADSISGHWSSVKNILPGVTNVKMLESHVIHPILKYCGIVDCVAVFKNQLVVIDWKTSQKQKPFVSMTYDTPLQIAAYIGAINYDPNYSLKIDEGLIVIAYEDGKTGHSFVLKTSDVAKYWDKWLQRLNKFYEMQKTENKL